jgi:hypothetical protein
VTIQCKICNQRRAKRHCPGADGEICALCCSEGREVTIECPRECPHLREARMHEAKVVLIAEQVPHKFVALALSLTDSRIGLLLLINLVMLLLGTALEPIPAMLITIPLFMPLMTAAGYAMFLRLVQHPHAPRWNYVVGDRVRDASEYLDSAMEYTLLLPRSR